MRGKPSSSRMDGHVRPTLPQHEARLAAIGLRLLAVLTPAFSRPPTIINNLSRGDNLDKKQPEASRLQCLVGLPFIETS
jgi:hypothetical protein